ncbi:MAG: phosphate acyltransferase PlsX [Deferribacteraceae bacterium]|jgi:glycerol-3-phosphate acyltransferase PlsX|nr:phosphate acyltransferase PlsX [Deferribacteraceae bacterium]
MKIAVDAMGGDNAPHEIVRGAIKAVQTYDIDVVLVGIEDVVREHLKQLLPRGDPRLTVVHADQVVNMDDKPSQIIRGKRRSSLHVGLGLVRDGEASAFYSAGNTGAVMATAILILRTLDGIDRPAIATALPSLNGHSVLIDAGANVDSKVENYLHFAIMGSAYAKAILGIETPKVGLLSIGEEDVKGNEITKNAFVRLKECKALKFIGNIEPKELFKGIADVMVCDGFIGNVALKSSEAVASFIGTVFKSELRRSLLVKLGALLMYPSLLRIKHRADPEEYGGAPLLGVGGICIIGHGRATADAVKNAVRVAKGMVLSKMNESIKLDVINSLNLL